MSEIKGQLLGIILVLTIFSAVCAALIPVYNKYTEKIDSQSTELTASEEDTKGGQTTNTQNVSNNPEPETEPKPYPYAKLLAY